MARLLPNQNYIAVNEALASQEHIKPGRHDGPPDAGRAGPLQDRGHQCGLQLRLRIDPHGHAYLPPILEGIPRRFVLGPGEVTRTNVEAVRDEIAKRFGNDRKLFVLPAREFKNEIRKVIDQGFAVNHAINIITMTIACLGIIVTLLASVLERTREIGILRSIGMLRSQVSRVVVIESMLLGIIGGTLGAGAGIIIGWMSLEGFLRGDYGASMQYHVYYALDLLGDRALDPACRSGRRLSGPTRGKDEYRGGAVV